MTLVADCEEYFGSRNLYDVLFVTATATDVELKKAYKKVSLLVHPDRVPDSKKAEATRKFQTLSQVYYILSDEGRRSAYDATGEVDDVATFPKDQDWDAFFRLLFPKVTEVDIEGYLKEYRGSNEEVEDLKKIYLKCEGDRDKICEWHIGYAVEEEPRYTKILMELIKKGELPDFPSFTKETIIKKRARFKRLAREAKQAEKAKKEMGDKSLATAIAERSASREAAFGDMMKNLEQKYVKKRRTK